MPISRKTQLKMLWLVNNAFIMIIFTYYNELIKLTHCHPSSKIYVTTMDPLLSLNPSSLKILFPIDIDPGGWSPVTFPYIIPQIWQAGLDWNASSIHSVQNVCPHLWRFFGFFFISMQMLQTENLSEISAKKWDFENKISENNKYIYISQTHSQFCLLHIHTRAYFLLDYMITLILYLNLVRYYPSILEDKYSKSVCYRHTNTKHFYYRIKCVFVICLGFRLKKNLMLFDLWPFDKTLKWA